MIREDIINNLWLSDIIIDKVSRSIGPLVSQSAGRLVQLVGQSVDRLVCRSIGRLVYWSVRQS